MTQGEFLREILQWVWFPSLVIGLMVLFVYFAEIMFWLIALAVLVSLGLIGKVIVINILDW